MSAEMCAWGMWTIEMGADDQNIEKRGRCALCSGSGAGRWALRWREESGKRGCGMWWKRVVVGDEIHLRTGTESLKLAVVWCCYWSSSEMICHWMPSMLWSASSSGNSKALR
jgi:hypothetical protein